MSFTHLDTQAQFEELWFNTTEEAKEKPWIVYFTAAWCAPCKKLDLPAIAEAAATANIPLYKCDYVVNEYTSGYCGVRAFPTFVCMKPKKIVSQIKSAETDAVKTWIASLVPG
jgi:thioredoxin-like negative regulator of GroEL